MAMPPAIATAWPSAMPTSKNRRGNIQAKPVSPVPSPMAAVMAHTRSSSRAKDVSVWPNTEENVSPAAFFSRPVARSNGPTP